MAVQDQDYPVPWTMGLHRALAAWPVSWTRVVKAARERVSHLLISDLFAFGLGGILWSVLIYAVVRTPL